MLIPTIAFDITDFKTGVSEHYLVDNSEINWERIAAHHFTRNIEFGQTFDFQFEKEMRMPTEMIEPRFIYAAMLLNFDSNQQAEIIKG